jgi:glucose uptake protein
MITIESYPLAVALSFIVMLAWGSWPNTLKLCPREWRFQLFYWDYAFGVLLFALLMALTLGSFGAHGRGFFEDVAQASGQALLLALLGGVVFNCYNLLLVSALDIAGIAVAFPIGVGLALVIGVSTTYYLKPEGSPLYVFSGLACIVIAVLLDAMAYSRIPSQGPRDARKGILLSLASSVFGGLFFFLVAASMAKMDNDLTMEAGKLSPYSAVVFFALGLVLSNFVLNTLVMWKPFTGGPVPLSDYFRKGTAKLHAIGVLGGLIWCVGMSFSILASNSAGPAVALGLGQTCTMVAAGWGIFIWREFKNARPGTGKFLGWMFAFYFLGIGLLILSVVFTATTS